MTSPLELVVQALTSHGHQPRGNDERGWTATCPAHEDSNPSLTVSEGGDHRALIHCHAGCATSDITSALNLTISDLFNGTTSSATRMVEDARYSYTATDGTHLYDVVRYWTPDGKTFRQQAADGTWTTKDVAKVPYHLPELIKAVAARETVFVVEGEKDVHSLERVGYVATTNPGGAGKWRPDYNPYFTGADIVIVADRDTPGRNHAQHIANQLTDTAATIRLAEPATGKDITDHLNAHLDVADLTLGLDHAEEPDNQPVVTPITFRAGGDWVLDAPPGIPAVWGKDDEVLWAEGESLIIAAPPGVGKTTIAVQLAWARLGYADTLLGYPVTPGERTILYLAMDRPRQIQRAMARIARPEQRDTLNQRLIIRPGPPPKDLARHPEVLCELANLAGADTVFIDSLKDAAIGLADDEVGSGLNRALQIVLAEGLELAALHHQRKGQNGTKPKTLEDVYGSSWIAAGAGSVVLLWGQPGDALVELTHLKQPGEVVGPLKIEHDHSQGRSIVTHGFDLLRYLRGNPQGVTSRDAAHARAGKQPTDNQITSARNALNNLVRKELAIREDGDIGGSGGSDGNRWRPVVQVTEWVP